MRPLRNTIVVAVTAAVAALSPLTAQAAPPGSAQTLTADFYNYARSHSSGDAEFAHGSSSDRSGLMSSWASTNCVSGPLCVSDVPWSAGWAGAGGWYRARPNQPISLSATFYFSVLEATKGTDLASRGNRLDATLSSGGVRSTCSQAVEPHAQSSGPIAVVVTCDFDDPDGGWILVTGGPYSWAYDNTGDGTAQTASMTVQLEKVEVTPKA